MILSSFSLGRISVFTIYYTHVENFDGRNIVKKNEFPILFDKKLVVYVGTV